MRLRAARRSIWSSRPSTGRARSGRTVVGPRHARVMSLLAALADLVQPVRCVACGSAAGALCGRCLPRPPAFRSQDAWAAAPYDGAVRTALLAYKERGRRDLAGVLGALLARAAAAALGAGHDPP